MLSRKSWPQLSAFPVFVLWLTLSCARAEEILGTDPAAPGHFQIEQRFGYFTTFDPLAQGPNVNRAAKSSLAVTGETEIGYGVADGYEIAVTTPYAYARETQPGGADLDYAFQTGGFTIRQTFMQPDYAEKSLYFGLVVRGIYRPPGGLTPELYVDRNTVPGLAGTLGPRFVMEANPHFSLMLTPLVGARFDDWEIMFNANFTTALDAAGSAFEPSLRIANHITDKWTVGIEYFANLGPIGEVVPWNQQTQTIYLVAGTKLFGAEVSAGVGYGLTAASRGPTAKISVGYDF
jgi:hypothetical protein